VWIALFIEPHIVSNILNYTINDSLLITIANAILQEERTMGRWKDLTLYICKIK
jgi:hypothetical protein